jgi:hypothetical protein
MIRVRESNGGNGGDVTAGDGLSRPESPLVRAAGDPAPGL